MEKYIVCVGPPFEEQTFYGPFDNFDEAAHWAEKHHSEYSWIVSLRDPNE